MKQPLGIVAMIYIAGILAGRSMDPPLVTLFLFSFFLAMLALIIRRFAELPLFALIFLLGMLNLSSRTKLLSPCDLRLILGEEPRIATLRGHLLEPPMARPLSHADREFVIVRLRAGSILLEEEWRPAAGMVSVMSSGVPETALFRGDLVEVEGVISPPARALFKDGFDYRQHLEGKQIYYQLRTHSTAPIKKIRGAEHPPWPDRFQSWAKETLARGFSTEDENIQLLWAMSLGWRSALHGEIKESFMRSGTLHLFAISGLHIGLIAGIILALLRSLQLPRSYAGMAAIPLLAFYAVATGAQPSAVRATVMMSVIIAGWSLRRPPHLLNSLGAAALLILLWDPGQLFQAGFQLSFCVVASIACFHPVLEKAQKKLLAPDPLLPPELRPFWQQQLDAPLRYLTGSLAVSLAAWTGSLPLIAWYFHLFTPVTLLANIAVVPLAAVTLMSVLGSLLAAPIPFVSECFNHSAWLFMMLMKEISERAARLPGAWWHVPPPSLLVICAYFLLLWGITRGWFFKPGLRLPLLALGIALATAIFLRWAEQRQTVSIEALPLGGGGILVKTPGAASSLLLDCGNESMARRVTLPWLRARGINFLPRLVLSHGDVNRMGGASIVRENYFPKEILTSPLRFRSTVYRRIMDELGGSENASHISRGDRIGEWKVLHPAREDKYSLADDGALVLLGTFHGTTVLLLSDLGREGQRTLLDREPDLQADIVIAGLPTRDEPVNDTFLAVVRPKLLIICSASTPAGAQARPPLRQRFAARNIPALYTCQLGAVTLRLTAKGCHFQTPYHGRLELAEAEAIIPFNGFQEQEDPGAE
jgi:competence protein ComEC